MNDKATYYKEKILEMINAINNPDFLCKIYYYIDVPYRMEMEKVGKGRKYDSK